MRTVLKVQAVAYAAIIALAVSLSGCASTLGFIAKTFDVNIVTPDVRQNAYKAASVTFAAWNSIQKGALIYGGLPPCTKDAQPTLCRDDQAWAKIQSITHNTTLVLDASRPVIAAGDSDVDALLALPAAVFDAQKAIEAAKKGE